MLKTSILMGTISTLKDRSLKAWFTTPEMTADEMSELFQLSGSYCAMVLQEAGADDRRVVEVKAVPNEAKSHGERLRAVLYVYFTVELKRDKKDFNSFYASWMESKIEEIKAKLPRE
jgi:hypothetical protein